jgi:hypothetical protein
LAFALASVAAAVDIGRCAHRGLEVSGADGRTKSAGEGAIPKGVKMRMALHLGGRIKKQIGFGHGTVSQSRSAYLTSSRTGILHFVIKVLNEKTQSASTMA